MPVGTAKCHAHRGQERLRERLERARRSMTAPAPPFGREMIESLIPHRPPFLLVDEILELEPGKASSASQSVPTTGGFRATSPSAR